MSAINSAVSGMQAAQTRLGAAAHNVANLSTENFRRQTVIQSEQAAGGVYAGVSQSSVVGNSLEGDLVGQLVAKSEFLANLAVFKAGSSMLGSLFDAKV